MEIFVQGEEPGEHGGKHPQHRGVAQSRQVEDEQVRFCILNLHSFIPPHRAVII